MVIDVDGERHRLDEPRLGAHAARTRAVDRDEDALGDVCGPHPLEAELLELEEAVLAGKRSLAAEEHHRVLPQLQECKLGREHRPEGVAVGCLVRGHEEAILLSEGGYDRLHVSRVLHRDRRGRARRSAS
jgi:hypothetical protein